MREKEWFDDDSFWEAMYPFMFPESRFLEADEQVDQILSLTRPAGKDVLDLACGPGRFAVALAQRGYAITGVDRTPFLLDKARTRAENARVDIEFVQEDMRDFVRPDSFDLVLSMFTSFGYFAEKQEDILVLENIFASLRPGGVCLIDVMGKERLARIFLATSSTTLPDGATLVERREIMDEWTRIRNEWLLIRGDTVQRYPFDLNIYSGQELRERLERVGFTGVKLYGSFEGEEYGYDAQRLVVTGRKPRS